MYKRSVAVSGEVLVYNLTRKRIKNYIMRVKSGGELFVSAPVNVSLESIDKFVTERIDFIHSARERARIKDKASPNFTDAADGSLHSVFGKQIPLFITEGRQNSLVIDAGRILMQVKDAQDERLCQAVLVRELCKMLYDTVLDMCRSVYPMFSEAGFAFPNIRLRRMTSRWGSCHIKKHLITFSTELVGVSPELIEYIVMHEMCHFLHADHSAGFYRELALRMPDWKARKNALSGR